MKNFILILCFTLVSTACRQEQPTHRSHTATVAENATTETCAACGMVVREQPAPRGQVVYRNGTRSFLCSIDDLVHFLAVPSPNGKPLTIYAEVMPDGYESDKRSTAWQSWDDANELFFVTDIERAAVMGKPALTFHTRGAAEKSAEKLTGKVAVFDQLRTGK